MERIRRFYFYHHYFTDFFESQTEKVKNKIDHVLFLISVAERVPVKFFKHVEGTAGLYEIRIEYDGNMYRIFSCFDEGNRVVLLNGFQKKSQKTPSREVKKALELKTGYFLEKEGRQHGNKK